MAWFGRVVITAAALGFLTARADARITHIEITKTEPAFERPVVWRRWRL